MLFQHSKSGKKYPLRTIYLNAELSRELLEISEKQKSKFIYFSSSEIYFANIEVLPINDNPFIVSQNIGNQTVFEDSFFVVDVSDFVIEDVDNIAPIATSQIVVNEFLAASDNCCMSPDGNYEDFVELVFWEDLLVHYVFDSSRML